MIGYKKIFSLCFLSLSIAAYAQTDSLYQVQQIRINALEKSMQSMQTNLQQKNSELKQTFALQQSKLDSLAAIASQNTANIQKTADQLGVKINETNATVSNNQTAVQQSLQSKTLWGIVAFVIALLIAVLVYWLLHKRINSSTMAIDKIRATQKTLQEESIKLDSKLVEILDTQMKLQQSQPAPAVTAVPDHLLALKVADEIVRIETNLSRMDATIKGYKQLSASVRRIKDNFLANGYEMVEMLGKPYNEGMRAECDFVIDENLKEGERIITSVLKPQVNYQGVIIQKAKITVSQNI